MNEKSVDLRSYFPKFERTLTWIDGTVYSIREIEDLSEAEFHSMLEEEQRLAEMSRGERLVAFKRHLQQMLVVAIPERASATAGAKSISTEGVADLKVGDVIYLTSGLYVERNVVTSTDGFIAVAEPWRFGASSESSRLFRAIRAEQLSDPNLTQKQLGLAIATVKNPPREDDEDVRPPKAANELTS